MGGLRLGSPALPLRLRLPADRLPGHTLLDVHFDPWQLSQHSPRYDPDTENGFEEHEMRAVTFLDDRESFGWPCMSGL